MAFANTRHGSLQSTRPRSRPPPHVWTHDPTTAHSGTSPQGGRQPWQAAAPASALGARGSPQVACLGSQAASRRRPAPVGSWRSGGGGGSRECHAGRCRCGRRRQARRAGRSHLRHRAAMLLRIIKDSGRRSKLLRQYNSIEIQYFETGAGALCSVGMSLCVCLLTLRLVRASIPGLLALLVLVQGGLRRCP